MSPTTRNNSTSEHDLDESVGTPEDPNDRGEAGGARPGRKKNPNTQAARRDQNRIAQREFRLRKQQKIRDLEARVELLSGNKEETYNQMRDIMRALMTENSQLRGLLKDLGRFIGDGAGGPLAQSLSGVGWQLEEFQSFLNRTETDTAVETFNAIKKARGSGAPTDDDDHDEAAPGKKRKRVVTDAPSSSTSGVGGGVYGPGPTQGSPTTTTSQQAASAFASLMGNQMFGPPASTYGGPPSSLMSQPTRNNSLTAEPSAPGSSGPYGSSFSPPMASSFVGSGPQRSTSGANKNLPSSASSSALSAAPLPAVPASSNGAPVGEMQSLFSEEPGSVEDESVMRKNEAGRLFRYHLDNFRRNPTYCLPRSLNPTLVQRTVPHEQIIDSIPFPEFRDRMILLKDRYLLPEVCHGLFMNCTIHGDDVLQHTNWELHRPFLEKYPFLIGENTLAIANKWRRERGDPEISMGEILKE